MHEGPRTLGFGAELAARISEELFYELEAPVLRATGFDTPYPPARLEKLWLPGVDRLLDCVEKDDAPAMTDGVRDFLVPDLGEGLEEATITAWSVAVGDAVELNQTLCTVETNKAEVEIPSPYAGRVVERGGDEGETLAVGAVLARIATGAAAGLGGGGSETQAGACRLRSRRWHGCQQAVDRAAVGPAPREAAGAQAGGGVERRPCQPGGLGSRRCDHARGRACRGRQVCAEPGHGRGAWCAGRDGAPNDVVAQSDTGRPRRCAGRLHWTAAAAGADARSGGGGFVDHPVRADAAAADDCVGASPEPELDMGRHHRRRHGSTCIRPCTLASALRPHAGCWCPSSAMPRTRPQGSWQRWWLG